MILIRKYSSFVLYGRSAAKSKNSHFFSSSQLRTSVSSFTSKANDPSPTIPFIVNYLTDSVGLSSMEAAKASKLIAHIKSPSNPNCVREFFRKNGFSETDIKMIILSYPKLLCANVDSTLKPKFVILRDLGFSETQINELFAAYPYSLIRMSTHNTRFRIELLNGFLGSNEDLVKAFTNNRSLLVCDIEKNIKPKISFLRECRLTNERIGSVIKNPNVICRSLSTLQTAAKRANHLGIQCGSLMFYHAFCILCKVNPKNFDSKLEVLRSLGFSSAALLSIVLRHPTIVALSDKNLCETVDFLVKKAGLELSYMCKYPSMVSLSLTKRLFPRNYVVQMINEKGISKKRPSFYYIVSMSEKKFMERFIFSFKKEMPELHDIYLSASAGRFLS